MNPCAEIIEAMYGKVDPEIITDTGIFDIEIANNLHYGLPSLKKKNHRNRMSMESKLLYIHH